MELLDLTLPTPAENLALDEALLLEAEHGHGGEMLRLWQPTRLAVIVGVAGRLSAEVRTARCNADGVPIRRRCSGGSAVLLGPGCLVYSLILARHTPELSDVTRSYRYILRRLCTALQPIDGHIRVAGNSDLAIGDRKVSGNSQRRLRRFLLHHGTLLVDFDISCMESYLFMPKVQPDYRRGRRHVDFVTNLRADVATVKQRLARAWKVEDTASRWPEDLVQELVVTKYEQESWTHRR